MKKYIILVLVLFFIVPVGGKVEAKPQYADAQSMRDIIDIMKKYKKESSREFNVVRIQTVFDGINNTDGKRYTWSVTIQLPKEKKAFKLGFFKGKFAGEVEVPYVEQETIDLDEIEYGSRKALQRAQDKFDLEPGDGSGIMVFYGYHFDLQKVKGRLLISVKGMRKGKFLEVYFDAKTGEYVKKFERELNKEAS